MNTAYKQWFSDFLSRLIAGGWQTVFSIHGWDMEVASSQQSVEVDRTKRGFAEFADCAHKPIEPGQPAYSLLYHALMHPGVVDDSITYWPELEDIDRLENYIYQLEADKLITGDSLSGYSVAVLSYEYRITARTPHKHHADLVFSRTGVGRVGTHEPEYDSERRCFNTDPSDNTGGTRVQPARYGLFLCNTAYISDEVDLQGRSHSSDEEETFVLPVIKLFNNMEINNNIINLTFDNYHQNDKLSRMVSEGKLKIDESFDITKPPFLYQSHRDDFVEEKQHDGSLIIWRKPQEMCRVAKQNNNIASFKVPKENYNSLKLFFKLIMFKYNNRRYTTLRVGQTIKLASLDLILDFIYKALGKDKRAFLSPRRAGEFTNIRHIYKDGEVDDLYLIDPKNAEALIKKGGYQAAMYEDAISEGYVTARFEFNQAKHTDVMPAYSLMTAPDFMPRVGNIDIYQQKENFTEGGPRALCEGRLPVNLRLRYKESNEAVFSEKEKTVTAIIAPKRTEGKTRAECIEYNNTHYMTDEASDVFAPGWDVTYTRDSWFSSAYYHTSGLGSPFLEDVKLCAAANGMWPVASPDAARTYKTKTRTAIPLTDIEIGLHKNSFLGNGKSIEGWDGEYGPFVSSEKNDFIVNYSSINRADYITNYQENLFSFEQLRKLSKYEIKRRMESLALVNKKIKNRKSSFFYYNYWLVSFMKVDAGDVIADSFNLPVPLRYRQEFEVFCQRPEEDGYLYIFTLDKEESDSLVNEDKPGRLKFNLKRFIVVFESAGSIKYLFRVCL